MSLVPKLPSHAEATIREFLHHHAFHEGGKGLVVGLSGGIDSALVARLARDAVGADAVLGVLLPNAVVGGSLVAETEAYARSLGIDHRTIPVGPIESALQAAIGGRVDRITAGNASARIRMTLLYSIARSQGRRVAGTGNKSELLLGYFTKYGDGGVDLLPIGDLYKTQLRELAERLGLPASIRRRAPSAGFWEGQTDEGELGISYEDVDQVLHGLEQLFTEGEIVSATGFPLAKVRAVIERVRDSRHKRRLPPVAKVSTRTVGIDWRE